MNIDTINIRTLSTITFAWTSRGACGYTNGEAASPREAVTAALDAYRMFARGDGAAVGIDGVLVAWSDGTTLRAFLHHVADDLPDEIRWITVRTKADPGYRGVR